jgi:hypothetical protein
VLMRASLSVGEVDELLAVWASSAAVCEGAVC